MTNRPQVFDLPHRGIRNGLSQFDLLATSTDYEDASSVRKLYDVGQELFILLKGHAELEEEIYMPKLDPSSKEVIRQVQMEHLKVEDELKGLENKLQALVRDIEMQNNIKENAFHLKTLCHQFHADYLQHMVYEESMLQPLMWRQFTDEELDNLRKESMSKIKLDEFLLWIKYVVPTQNPNERSFFLNVLKSTLPAEAFSKVNAMAERVSG